MCSMSNIGGSELESRSVSEAGGGCASEGTASSAVVDIHTLIKNAGRKLK